MDDLLIYLRLGFRHIIDFNGSDHILFILALVIRYVWTDWKKILVLVTSFTIGHSVTLALSTLNWLNFPASIIELLIPITILLTALSNYLVKDFSFTSKYPFIYFAALFFGLIHGLGFSNYLKSLLGQEESIIGPLFSFIFVSLFKVDRRLYLRIGSFITCLFALEMVLDRIVPFFN